MMQLADSGRTWDYGRRASSHGPYGIAGPGSEQYGPPIEYTAERVGTEDGAKGADGERRLAASG
jgi:hypothetical protein